MGDHRRFAASRRILVATIVVVATPALLLLIPVLGVATLIGDGLRRRADFPTTSLLGMVLNALVLEWIGIVAAFGLWIATGFGSQTHRPWSQRMHYAVQEWWAQAMTNAARRWTGLRFVVENIESISNTSGMRDEAMDNRPVIIAAHHSSFVDALLPSVLLRMTDRRPARHVLKRELALDPCLGIYGHRQPNHFVDRASNDSSVEVEAILRLASTAGDASLVIFPEGTFRSATDPDRIFAKLARNDPQRAQRLALSHTLPPRPGGLMALCAGAPANDVVFVAHRGLTKAGSIGSILRGIRLDEPVRVRLWRVPASQLHGDRTAALAAIDNAWQQMDDWIGAV